MAQDRPASLRSWAGALLLTLACLGRTAAAASLAVSWTPAPAPAVGYMVYYGTVSGSYTGKVDAGSASSLTLQQLSAATTYYVAVTSYDSYRSESALTAPVSAATAVATPTTTPTTTPATTPTKTPTTTPTTTPTKTPTTTPTTTPVTVPVVTACPCTIWSPGTRPVNPATADTQAVNLGVKFTLAKPGFITHLRFYKSARNTGVHIGALWTRSGQLLAKVQFSGETASGWQEMRLAAAVPVVANTVYVASYHTNTGWYADDDHVFGPAGLTSGLFHVLGDGVAGANGVYTYGSGLRFPMQGYMATNYWVDVVFSATK